MDIYAKGGQTKKRRGRNDLHQDSLNELEAAMLKKRLKFLRAQGATGKPTYRLGDDFFKQMEDHWTFCSALADIYAVKEMGDQRRDDAVAATLPSSTEEDWKDEDNEAIETGDLLARLVVNELLSDEDTEGELAEPADRSDVIRMQSRKPILPPSRAVLVLLPLTLIDVLDYVANVLKMHRTDVIRRSLMRDVNSALREEVSRAQRHQAVRGWSGP